MIANIPSAQPFIYINLAIASHLIQGFQIAGCSQAMLIVSDLDEQIKQGKAKRSSENDEDLNNY